jgi:hypothetical protein
MEELTNFQLKLKKIKMKDQIRKYNNPLMDYIITSEPINLISQNELE